jgi:hypothetical protein
MTNLKRFSKEELRKYVADHKIGVNSKYVSEPHTVVKAVKRIKRRIYRGPATHFEVMGVVGSKLDIVYDQIQLFGDSVKVSEGLKKRGIKFHIYEDYLPDRDRLWFRTRKEVGKALTHISKVLVGDFAVIKVYDENC